MAILEVVKYPAKVLRRKAKAVREVDTRIQRLMDDMIETMVDEPGLGLAAPQVGESVRVIVARDDEREFALANPKIVHRAGRETAAEGCLSLPGLRGDVSRAKHVTVTGLNRSGKRVQIEAEGLLARVFQHEIDHLDGKLFVDRVEEDTLCWLVPDDEAEDGYTLQPTALVDALAELERTYGQREPERESSLLGNARVRL
jgi:peptide deformylase